MGRRQLLDALAELNDEQFTHVAFVCNDIAKRLPEGYEKVGKGAREVLGIPEPEPVKEEDGQ